MTGQPDRDIHDREVASGTEQAVVRSTLILWTVWARETCAQARRARAAEETFRARHGGADTAASSEALGEELQSAVVAICSAAFAVETVVRSLATHLPPAGKESNSARVTRVLAASVADPALATSLAERWRPIIALRNDTVHYDEEARDLDWHPSGLTRTAVESRTYNAGQAEAAAHLLLDTLTAIRDHPTPAVIGKLPDADPVGDELRAILDP